MEIVRSIINLIPIFTSEVIEDIPITKDDDTVIVQSNESISFTPDQPTRSIQSSLKKSRNKKSYKRLDTCDICGH
jgi:hypothetical protein